MVINFSLYLIHYVQLFVLLKQQAIMQSLHKPRRLLCQEMRCDRRLSGSFIILCVLEGSSNQTERMPRNRTEQQNASQPESQEQRWRPWVRAVQPGLGANSGWRPLSAALARVAHSELAHYHDAQPGSTSHFHTSFPISCLTSQILRSKYKIALFGTVLKYFYESLFD